MRSVKLPCQVESSSLHSIKDNKNAIMTDLIIKILLVKYILNLQRYHNKTYWT